MKFVTYEHNGQSGYGAIVDAGIVDLGKRYADLPDLREAIRQDRLGELAQAVASADPDIALADVTYLPPIPNPEKIICIGINYADRNEEYKDGTKPPEYPSVFMRARESLTGHDQPLLDPPESDQLDYEGEIVIVIGKSGRRIPKERTHEYVAGLTIMNEGSVRDWLRHARFNVTQGKNFEQSGSTGPWLVTPDEVDPMSELRITTRVNGEIRQNDTTHNLIFDFRYLISYLSTFYHLQPGDTIATGTPNGAGARFDPPKYLKSGDTVEVEVPGIGILSNRVETETP